MVFNATYFSYIVAVSYLGGWVEETEYPEKTTDLPQATDKRKYIYHLLYINYLIRLLL